MPWRLTSEPTTGEKICAGLSYATFGIAGLLYMLLSKGGNQSQMFRFHMYQAVLLWLLSTLISYAAGPLFGILFGILGAFGPGISAPVAVVVRIAATAVSILFTICLGYGAVMAFLGKFAEVPFISNLVRQNMRA